MTNERYVVNEPDDADDELVATDVSVCEKEKRELKVSEERFFQKYIGGDLFKKETFIRQMPFFIYIVALSMLYITNTYMAEDMRRELQYKNNLLEIRHVEYIFNESEITKMSKQSYLAKELKPLGIKESVEPLKKITAHVEEDNKD